MIKASDKKKKQSNTKIVMNVYCTEYEVIKKVGRKLCNYKLKEFKEDNEGGVIKG